MAERLRSISSRIHWSLLLKAAAFALAWFWFPWWLFAAIALLLYFIPFFQSGKLALPFFVLLVLSCLQPPTVLFFLIFGALFYVLLLIKDLLLIDRATTHELLTFALVFLLIRDFYLKFDGGPAGAALLFSFILAFLVALLVKNYISSFRESEAFRGGLARIGVWLSFFLTWQLVIAGLFLPLDFIYQTAIIFLPIVLIIDLLPDHLSGALRRPKLVSSSIAIFILLTIVLVSARWGL